MVKLSELKAAKRDGAAAHASGAPRATNPAPPNSPLQTAWWAGWDRAESKKVKASAEAGSKAKWFQEHLR